MIACKPGFSVDGAGKLGRVLAYLENPADEDRLYQPVTCEAACMPPKIHVGGCPNARPAACETCETCGTPYHVNGRGECIHDNYMTVANDHAVTAAKGTRR